WRASRGGSRRRSRRPARRGPWRSSQGRGGLGRSCPRSRALVCPTVSALSSAQPDETTPDLHTTAGKLAELDRRIDEAVHAGSAKAVEKQHAKGRKTARERIEMLFDEGSFQELDELARHRSTAF